MQNNSVIQHNNWLSTAADKRARYAQSGLAVHSVDETTHQLKCKPCIICETFTPTISPIRMTWPGKPLHDNIEMYREVVESGYLTLSCSTHNTDTGSPIGQR